MIDTENFYDDALRSDTNLPAGLLGNPLLDDEPTPLPERPDPRAAAPAPPEPEKPEPAPAPAAPTPPPAAAPPPQAPTIDPMTLGHALAYAMQQNQGRPVHKPEDFDPPELDIDAAALLEDPDKLKRALRDIQVSTARSVRDQVFSALEPEIAQGRALAAYQQSRVPIDEANARSVARSHLIRQGTVSEADADVLLDTTAAVIANRWDYRLNPNGWVGAAQYVLSQGAMPVREKAKPPAGAGKGDAPGAKRRSKAASNPYIQAVSQLNGKPLSEGALATFEEKFA